LGVELLRYALIWFACAALHTQLAAQRDTMRSLELEKQLRVHTYRLSRCNLNRTSCSIL
jgi:hypothetical protein